MTMRARRQLEYCVRIDRFVLGRVMRPANPEHQGCLPASSKREPIPKTSVRGACGGLERRKAKQGKMGVDRRIPRSRG